MMSPSNLLDNPKPYTGRADISFDKTGEDRLEVYIETDRLQGKFATECQLDEYTKLFQNAIVMEHYLSGTPKAEEWIRERISTYTKRVNEDCDPFSAIAFFDKEKESEPFVCHVVAGHGAECGQSEIAYVTNPEYWNQGLTKEAATSVVHHYLPRVRPNYEINGHQLKEVVATISPKNIASLRIAVDLCMTKYKVEHRYGRDRWRFKIQAQDFDRLNNSTI